jgi:DNA-binding transcriptional LysR family regulator
MQLTNLPDLSAKELLAIVAIAEYGSFVGASSFLKMSLPTLSRTVKRVEKVVGVVLFERSTRRVEITPAGRHFVAVAQRLLSDLQLSLQHLGDVAAEQRGQVIVSTFPVFAHETLPPILREYRVSRPQVQIQIRQGRFGVVLEDVLSGLADFGISYVDSLPETVQRVNLRREPLYVVIPHDHPLGSKSQRVALKDLQKQPMISLPGDSYTRRVIEGATSAAGIWLDHSVIVPGFLDILNLVMAGVGIGIVPGGVLADRFLSRMKVRLLTQPALSLSVGLVALRTRHVTPAAAGLIKLLVDTVRAQQPSLRTKYLSTAGFSIEDLAHGPYELMWRPATSPDVKAPTDGKRRKRTAAAAARVEKNDS